MEIFWQTQENWKGIVKDRQKWNTLVQEAKNVKNYRYKRNFIE